MFYRAEQHKQEEIIYDEKWLNELCEQRAMANYSELSPSGDVLTFYITVRGK